MSIESVEQLATLRQSVLNGDEISLDQLREIADFIRAQRGIRGPKKGAKAKAQVNAINSVDALAKIFGV